jgi:integrase
LEQRLAGGEAWTDNDLVFCGTLGGPRDARSALKAYQRITMEAGLGKATFHALRHTSGTLAARVGINPKYISDRLGHANATFTINTYVHTTTDAESMAAEAIAEAMRHAR